MGQDSDSSCIIFWMERCVEIPHLTRHWCSEAPVSARKKNEQMCNFT
jgi:hypothetical protein